MSGSSIGTLPADWRAALGAAVSDATLATIEAKVAAARAVPGDEVYPPAEQVFAALQLTPLDDVRAVIIGQDPYHGPGQAHGLSFSVASEVRPLPPSLKNIRSELKSDLGLDLPEGGSLEPWARHGVLLLNAVLTVGRGRPGSHKTFGWQDVTTAIVRVVETRRRPIAFLLWGKFASATAGPIDETRHAVVRTSHPSPLSRNGFLGKRPFSEANRKLVQLGAEAIDWSLE